jgi:hypothetical protein
MEPDSSFEISAFCLRNSGEGGTTRLRKSYATLSETLDSIRAYSRLDLLVPKCVTCSGTLTKTEAKCFMCGTLVVPNRTSATLQERFFSIVKVGLIISCILTVASIFTDYVPSFTKCMVATLILGLVKSSAKQMSENGAS